MAGGQDCGWVAVACGDAPGTLVLSKLFIKPRRIGSGIGSALLTPAVAEPRRRGAFGRGVRPGAAALRSQVRR
jgi:hypothetical protein